MINANMRSYDYYTYGKHNDYGQQKLSTSPVGTIKMSIGLTSKNTVDNVKYQEAQYIGLTMDQKVNESYVIQFGKEKLKVLYVNPFGRYNQVFMVTV